MLRTEARAGTDRPLAALALSAFSASLPQEAHEDFISAWQKAEEKDRLCIELAAEEMLKAGRAAWAWDACEIVAGIPTYVPADNQLYEVAQKSRVSVWDACKAVGG